MTTDMENKWNKRKMEVRRQSRVLQKECPGALHPISAISFQGGKSLETDSSQVISHCLFLVF